MAVLRCAALWSAKCPCRLGGPRDAPRPGRWRWVLLLLLLLHGWRGRVRASCMPRACLAPASFLHSVAVVRSIHTAWRTQIRVGGPRHEGHVMQCSAPRWSAGCIPEHATGQGLRAEARHGVFRPAGRLAGWLAAGAPGIELRRRPPPARRGESLTQPLGRSGRRVAAPQCVRATASHRSPAIAGCAARSMPHAACSANARWSGWLHAPQQPSSPRAEPSMPIRCAASCLLLAGPSGLASGHRGLC